MSDRSLFLPLSAALRFYIKPINVLKSEFKEDRIPWFQTLWVYLIALVYTALLSLVVNKFSNDKFGIKEVILYFPFFTVPYIILFTLLGFLFFKEFARNFQSHFTYAVQTVSFGYVWGTLLIFIITGYIHNGRISGWVSVILFMGVLHFGRFAFNLLVFKKCKGKVLKSALEMLLVAILVLLIIGYLILYTYNHLEDC